MTLFDNICKVKFEIGDANRPGDSLTTFKAGRLGLSEISDKTFRVFYISDFQHLNPNWNPQFQVPSILGSNSSSIKLPKLETKLTRFNMASRKKNDSTQHNADADAEIAAKIKLDEGSLHYNLQNRQDFIIIKQITIRLAVRGLFEPLARNAPQT